MNSSSRWGGSTLADSASRAPATSSGTICSGPRSAPSATASWATRMSAPVWLAVNADDVSGSTVSRSAPAAPRPDTTSVATPSARARSSTAEV